MKQVYLDINGDILNEIFGLEPENNLDEVLQELISVDIAKPKKKKDGKKDKEKDKKKKKKEKTSIKVRKVTLRRIK